MKKKILLFDIDKTIFDTDKASVIHNEHVLQILNTSDLEKIKKIKEDYRNTLVNEREYKPEEYLELLAERFDFKDLDALLEVYYSDKYKFSYQDSVFPEFFEVVDELKGKYTFGIYSEGTKKFQNNKFESMGIRKYFDQDLIFIVDAKDTQETLARIPKNVVIVDDKERICEFLTQNKIRAIWLNKKDNQKSKNFETIHSLLELPQVLLY